MHVLTHANKHWTTAPSHRTSISEYVFFWKLRQMLTKLTCLKEKETIYIFLFNITLNTFFSCHFIHSKTFNLFLSHTTRYSCPSQVWSTWLTSFILGLSNGFRLCSVTLWSSLCCLYFSIYPYKIATAFMKQSCECTKTAGTLLKHKRFQDTKTWHKSSEHQLLKGGSESRTTCKGCDIGAAFPKFQVTRSQDTWYTQPRSLGPRGSISKDNWAISTHELCHTTLQGYTL